MFIYWGWESAVNLNEETEDSDSAPGLAAVLSTVILLGTYVIVIAVVSFAGLDRIGEFEDDAGIFGALAGDVLGSPLDKLVVLAIITSALSSTQTTILPASRTTLSMARQGAFPKAFGEVHPRFLTPHVSTIVIGVAAVWFGVLFPLSENFVYDSLTALSLMIAFYYALTGIACAVYYRRELTKSVKNFFFIGVGPLIGAGVLGYLFVKAIIEYSKTDQSYSGSALFGVAMEVVLGLGLLLLGVVLSIVWRLGGHEEFFERKTGTSRSGVAAGPSLGVAAVRRRRSDGSDRAGLRRLAGRQAGAGNLARPGHPLRRPAGDRVRRGAARTPTEESYAHHQALQELGGQVTAGALEARRRRRGRGRAGGAAAVGGAGPAGRPRGRAHDRRRDLR